MPLLHLEDDALEQTKQEFDLKGVIPLEPSSIRRGLRQRFEHEFDPYCTNTYGWRVSEQAAAVINRLVATHDLVWLHNVRIPNMLGRKIWPRSVLDLDDVPSQYYRSAARQAKSLNSYLANRRNHFLWRWREKVLLNRFSILAVCSQEDKIYLGGDERIHVIPNGYDAPARTPIEFPANPQRLGFIGTLDYPPNLEGIQWFIKNVWPKIKAVEKDVRLRLVGFRTDSNIVGDGVDIDGLGWVKDPSDEIASWTQMIVPIHFGAGTRIKIAEAFGRGCPVVSTTLGAFGYAVTHEKELLIADSPRTFADACLAILRSPELGRRLTTKARERFCREWTWDAIGPRVAAAVDACLQITSSLPEPPPSSPQ